MTLRPPKYFGRQQKQVTFAVGESGIHTVISKIRTKIRLTTLQIKSINDIINTDYDIKCCQTVVEQYLFLALHSELQHCRIMLSGT